MFRTIRNIGLAFGLCVISLSVAGMANNQEKGAADPNVLPPESTAYGKSYGEWQAEWWKWAASFPRGSTPMTDPDGRFAAQSQSGHVWFLAGFESGGLPGAPTPETITRTCTVPAGKALFFPVVEMFGFVDPWMYNPEYVPGTPHLEDDFAWFSENEALLRDPIAATMDGATELSCEIDGQPVRNIGRYRTWSTIFTLWLPEDNMFDAIAPSPPYPEGGLPEGVYGPAVDQGCWLMLAPLPVGQHTVHFHSAFVWLFPPEVQTRYHDVTYNLTVVPAGAGNAGSSEARLPGSWLVTVTLGGEGAPPPFESPVSFTADGVMIGSQASSPDLLFTPFHGTWTKTGRREFVFTAICYYWDRTASGVWKCVNKEAVTIEPDGDTYNGQASTVDYGPNGEVLAGTGATHGVRIKAE